MQFSSLLVVFAAVFAAAYDTTTEGTTTITSTATRTLTITQCNPTVIDCPYATPAEPTPETTEAAQEAYPVYNTTMSVGPTGGYKNATLTKSTATATLLPGGQSTEPATVTDSGAAGLYINSGLFLGVLAAGAALL